MNRLVPCLVLLAGTLAHAADVWKDPSFFPLSVWVQQPRLADRYKAIGINTYVAPLWAGGKDEQVDLLRKHGMRAIVHQNAAALDEKNKDVVIAFMHGDEPDNAQALPKGQKGWGPPILPSKIVEDYKRLKERDPRPVLLNLGQGVAYDNYIGRGVRRGKMEDYPEYVKGCDIASFDIYPVTHDKPEIAGKLEFVGLGVERLVKWTEGKKPVFACIETTRIHGDVLPNGDQIRSEVWIAITHGATGIIYFCHEWKPKFVEAGLLSHANNAKAVGEINRQITKLAPVLNAKTEAGLVEVTTEKDVPMKALVKRHDGALYVFAVNLRNTATTARFKLREGKSAEVIDEDRTRDVKDGAFDDAFAPHAVHLYRVKG
jgi:hypothetical protein